LSAQIQNMSETRLKIQTLSYPDDLFKIRLSDSDLKPGEKSKLMVKVNRRAEQEKFEKSITFELNDQQKTRFTIPVKKDPPALQKQTGQKPSQKPGGK